MFDYNCIYVSNLLVRQSYLFLFHPQADSCVKYHSSDLSACVFHGVMLALDRDKP